MRRDEVFKALHKRLAPSSFYALDADLILVEKIPPSTVYTVAHLEFKMGNEPIKFVQAVYFNQIVDAPMPWRVPVFIIRAREPYEMPDNGVTQLSYDFCQRARREHRFDIFEYVHGDWRPDPPRVELATIAENLTWNGIIEWERELRRARREALAPYLEPPRLEIVHAG